MVRVEGHVATADYIISSEVGITGARASDIFVMSLVTSLLALDSLSGM